MSARGQEQKPYRPRALALVNRVGKTLEGLGVRYERSGVDPCRA